jgi:hypothetical protein
MRIRSSEFPYAPGWKILHPPFPTDRKGMRNPHSNQSTAKRVGLPPFGRNAIRYVAATSCNQSGTARSGASRFDSARTSIFAMSTPLPTPVRCFRGG